MGWSCSSSEERALGRWDLTGLSESFLSMESHACWSMVSWEPGRETNVYKREVMGWRRCVGAAMVWGAVRGELLMGRSLADAMLC